LSLPAALAGMQGRCPLCKHTFPIPRRQETSALRVSSEPTVSHEPVKSESESSATWLTASGPVAHPPGFVIVAELGKGGMGVVYKAEQIDLKRVVALKMIRAADDATAQERDRFRAEAESLARLRHPNIVSIYEVGEHQGRPFFSLEYLEGGSLNHKLAGNPQPPNEAAALVEKLAAAVEAAHRANIVHRDLKPANILLTAAGEPKITDFGLAKQLDVDRGQTRSGAIMGTPSYMAPEQAKGLGKEVGPGADIYALGVILYEMLTGRPPFKGATPVDTLLQVAQDEPVPPSQLLKKIPVDLETICLKCLRKEPAQRYGSAGELARELRSFLEGRPIQARPIGAWERALKWSKRRPAAAALLAVSVLATLGFLALLVYFTGELAAERNVAVAEKNTAQKQKEIADDAKSKAEKATADALAAKLVSDQLKVRAEKGEEDARQQLRQTERTLFTAQVGRAASLWQTDPTEGVNVLRDLRICPPDERDFAWHFYYRLCQTERVQYANGQDGSYSIRFSPDGERVVSGCHDESARVWDLASGRLVHRLVHSSPVQDAIYSKDGKSILTGGWDGTVRTWDADTGMETKPLGKVSGWIMQLALHPQGEWVAVASSRFNEQKKPMHFDGAVSLFNLTTGETKTFIKGHATGFGFLDFSPDGKLLAGGTTAGGSGPTAFLWDFATGKRAGAFGDPPPNIIKGLKFSPNGRYIAYIAFDNLVRIWNPETRKDAGVLRGHVHLVKAIDFSPDGRLLATVGDDKFVRIWDVESRKELLSYRDFNSNPVAFTPDGKAVLAERRGHLVHIALPDRLEDRTLSVPGGITALTFSPDSKHLASISSDKVVRLWNPLTGKQTVVGKYADLPGQAAFAPDSRTLYVAAPYEDAEKNKAGQIARWDVAAGKPLAPWLGHKSRVVGVAVSKARQRLASFDASRNLTLWDLNTGNVLAEAQVAPGPSAPFPSLEFVGDSSILAVYGQGSQFWDVTDDRLVLKVKSTIVARPTPDGKRLAAGGTNFKLWDVDGPLFDSFRRELTLDQKTLFANPSQTLELGATGAFAFSPDGKSLAMGGTDRTVRVFDLATGQLRAALTGHFRGIPVVAFSPDGKLLASGDRDLNAAVKVWNAGDIKIWNARPSPHIGHNGIPDRITFCTDGSAAASRSLGRSPSIIVWDRMSGDEVWCLYRPELGAVLDHQLSGDGKRLATAHAGGVLRLWDVATRKQIAQHTLPESNFSWSLASENGAIVVIRPQNSLDFFDDRTLELKKHWDVPADLFVMPNLPRGTDWFVCYESAALRRMVVVFPETKTQLLLPHDEKPKGNAARGAVRLNDDRVLVIQSGKGTVHDIRADKSLHAFEGIDGFAFEASPDGKTLASRHMARERLYSVFEINAYDIAAGMKRRTLRLPGEYAADVVWVGNELIIATSVGAGIRFWPPVKLDGP
jgi:WD40 repeat protein/tRNA A-37 threonylcarbamoyl transferase component Bud32